MKGKKHDCRSRIRCASRVPQVDEIRGVASRRGFDVTGARLGVISSPLFSVSRTVPWKRMREIVRRIKGAKEFMSKNKKIETNPHCDFTKSHRDINDFFGFWAAVSSIISNRDVFLLLLRIL